MALQYLGSFKEGVGFFHKICRCCEITINQAQNTVVSADCVRREEPEHRRHCAIINAALTKCAKQYWFKIYGINSVSPLLEVPFFSLTECLLFDPKHCLFEGISAVEMKLLLLYLINEQHYLTVTQFTRAVSKISL